MINNNYKIIKNTKSKNVKLNNRNFEIENDQIKLDYFLSLMLIQYLLKK